MNRELDIEKMKVGRLMEFVATIEEETRKEIPMNIIIGRIEKFCKMVKSEIKFLESIK